jgi:peptidyl-prolyl cis-trans isomerase A (cyclophilin A)
MTNRRTLLGAALITAVSLFNGCSKPKHGGPAPAQYRVRFTTTKGDFVVLVHRDWAPLGADRFYELVNMRYFDGNALFRVLPGFIVQWGINGDPKVAKDWSALTIKDDPVKESNRPGTITFATSGPETRTTQVFINYDNNTMLDAQGFAPFGEVSEGMNVVQEFYAGYGEGAPRGAGPDQNAITDIGNAYLEEHFPRLDYIKKARLIE